MQNACPIFFRVINNLYNEGGVIMLLSEIMMNILSSDWAYGSIVLAPMIITLIINIIDDKRDRRGK